MNMMRHLFLDDKNSGNREYVCAGGGCRKCELRFACFTERKTESLHINWIDLSKRYKGSPTDKLRGLTRSKVWVKGSKRYEYFLRAVKKEYGDVGLTG